MNIQRIGKSYIKKSALAFSILISSCILLCSCKGGETESQMGQSGTAEEVSDGTSEPIPAVSEEESYFREQDNTISNAEPIDKSLDCEGIILERAASLQTLMSSYLSYDKNSLAFELGEYRSTGGQADAYRVVSDEFDSYEGFENLFSDSIYEGYIDKICSWNPRICEMDNELYFVESVGGYIGTLETWYLGYDVADDRIVGHFARLCGVEAAAPFDAEYLNDESNYSFYDITVQNIDGKYVLTDCRGEDNDMYYRLHGWRYNSGAADRSLITNERVKPAFLNVRTCTSEETEIAEEVHEYSSEGIECEPIDKSLDCEAILLEKANRLQTLMTDYLNLDAEKLVFKLGEPYYNENGMIIGSKVISSEMNCYADFKAMFSDSIYGEYFDYMNTYGTYLFDIDGELCCCPHVGGFLGTDETWYIGFDVQDDRIIGHFAQLRGLGAPEEYTAEYLNDESNYWFYDITVQCVEGVYVITDCREISSGRNYEFYDTHGLCYNSGFADRTLITNDRVKPAVAFITEGSVTSNG